MRSNGSTAIHTNGHAHGVAPVSSFALRTLLTRHPGAARASALVVVGVAGFLLGRWLVRAWAAR